MPKASEKSKILDFLARKTIENLIDVDSSEEEDKILEEFFDDVTTVVCHRRAVPYTQPKLKADCKGLNQNAADKIFFDKVQIDSVEFEYILSLIRDNALFKLEIIQLPLRLQLQLTLMRLCNESHNVSIRKISETFGIGNGGTTVNVTRRIFKALQHLKKHFIKWPDARERNEIVQKTAHEMPGCIGYVKVLEMSLHDVPLKLRSLYYSQDQEQSTMKVLIVCDYLLRIRHVSKGYPGSISNEEILSQCSLSTTPDHYFDTPQWLAGNGAEFSKCDIVITPFTENNDQMSEMRTKFNQFFTKYSARIDNCFTELRQRFPSLNEIKYPNMKHSSNIYCHQWILICCILHNMLQKVHAVDRVETFATEHDIKNFEYPQRFLQSKYLVRETLCDYILETKLENEKTEFYNCNN